MRYIMKNVKTSTMLILLGAGAGLAFAGSYLYCRMSKKCDTPALPDAKDEKPEAK